MIDLDQKPGRATFRINQYEKRGENEPSKIIKLPKFNGKKVGFVVWFL